MQEFYAPRMEGTIATSENVAPSKEKVILSNVDARKAIVATLGLRAAIQIRALSRASVLDAREPDTRHAHLCGS